MAHDVFVSYSTNDGNVANAMVNALESAGVRCWIAPRDIKPGEIWAQAIMDALTGTRVEVVVFSASANRSPDVLNEVDAAIRKGVIVIPFRIEDVMPEGAMEYHLRTRHWLDAMTPDLESGIARLVADVKSLLAGEPRPAAPPSPPPRPTPRPQPVSDSKVMIRIPRLTVFVARLWHRQRRAVLGAAGFLVLALVGWLVFGGKAVNGVRFAVKVPNATGKDYTLTIRERRMRFFEGGDEITPREQRVYATRFPAVTTRFIKIELDLEHDKPGRVVAVPINCTILKTSGAIAGTLTDNLRLQPEWEDTPFTVAWGSSQGGTWSPGRYQVDCFYAGKVIGRDHFEITGDDARLKGPPDIPSLGAHVIGVRFFESGKGQLPAPRERIYAERFEVAATRFVNIEIRTQHPPSGRSTEIAISCTFYKPDGSVLAVDQRNFTNPADYENTSFPAGAGWPEPGRWVRGVHRVVCVHEGKQIAQGNFEILGAAAVPVAPPPSLATTFDPSVPDLNGRVTALRLFEGPREVPPNSQRRYAFRYAAARTRYLFVELTISHEPPGRLVELSFPCVYTDGAGHEVYRSELRTRTQADWRGTIWTTGTGRATPGAWAVGSYVVTCSLAGKTVASARFEVE